MRSHGSKTSPHTDCAKPRLALFFIGKNFGTITQKKLNVMDYVRLSISLSTHVHVAFKITIKLDYLKILFSRSWSTE